MTFLDKSLLVIEYFLALKFPIDPRHLIIFLFWKFHRLFDSQNLLRHCLNFSFDQIFERDPVKPILVVVWLYWYLGSLPFYFIYLNMGVHWLVYYLETIIYWRPVYLFYSENLTVMLFMKYFLDFSFDYWIFKNCFGFWSRNMIEF